MIDFRTKPSGLVSCPHWTNSNARFRYYCCDTGIPLPDDRKFRQWSFAYFVDIRGIVGMAKWLVGNKIVPTIDKGCGVKAASEGATRKGHVVVDLVVPVLGWSECRD